MIAKLGDKEDTVMDMDENDPKMSKEMLEQRNTESLRNLIKNFRQEDFIKL